MISGKVRIYVPLYVYVCVEEDNCVYFCARFAYYTHFKCVCVCIVVVFYALFSGFTIVMAAAEEDVDDGVTVDDGGGEYTNVFL